MAWWNVGGITSCQCALQFVGAPCLPIALLDLTGNGNNATLAGTTYPTWDNVNGLKGNGSGYASIPVTPAASWSAIIKFTNGPTSPSYLKIFGCCNGSGLNGFMVGVNNSNTAFFQNGTQANENIPVTQGIYAIAGTGGYANGTSLTTSLSNNPTSLSAIFLLAASISGSATGQFSGDIQAFAIYNTVLSASQVAAITAAMNALAIPAALGAAAAEVSRINYYPSANLGSQAAASTKRYFYPSAANLGVSATTARRTQYHPVTARIGDSAGVTWTINENNIWGDDEWNPWAYGLNHPFRLRRIRGLQRMTPYAPHGYDQ